jgi:peptidoglycan/LPS O-acetylase OafA/YrhL
VVLGRAKHIESLTALRGFACVFVMFYHIREWIFRSGFESLAYIFDYGYLGVDLFFVLSGFVIQNSYGDHALHYCKRNFLVYMVSRYARVWPAHIVVLLAMLIFPLSLYLFSSSKSVPSHYDLDYFFFSVLLVQNWGFQSALKWNVPAWSISVETFSYLLFPLMSMFFGKWPRGGGIFYNCIILLCICFACFALQYIYGFFGAKGIGDQIESLGLLRCFFEFFVGVCVASISRDMRGLICAGIFLGVFACIDVAFVSSDNYVAVVPLLFALVILVSVVWNPVVSRFSLGRCLLFLGVISYSIYLVHMPIKYLFIYINLASLPLFWVLALYLGLVLLSAWLLNRLVEIPAVSWMRLRLGA